MAASADSHYFPALDKCLTGDAKLVSWRAAFYALGDLDIAAENSHLETFFLDNETIAALRDPLNPFEKPSTRSVAEFETKTAPIQISQTVDGEYNLDEIKKDARWLSQVVQIEDVSALRIAILEWQERAADQLLLTAMNGTDNTTTFSALASSNWMKSLTASSIVPSGGRLANAALDFSSEAVRHKRLLDVYLDEKVYVLKVVSVLVSRSCVLKSDLQSLSLGSLQQQIKKTWVDDIASKVREQVFSSERASGNGAFSLHCIQKIASIIRQATGVSSYPEVFAEDDRLASAYMNSQLSELVDTLSLLLSNLRAFEGIPNAATLQGWFSLMQECDFLQDAGLQSLPGMDAPRLVAAVVSVEILKPHLVVGEIMRSAGIDVPEPLGDFYFKQDACIHTVNDALFNAVNRQIVIAAPAIYAWGIITSVIRDIAIIHREASEKRLESSGESSRDTRRGSRSVRSDIENLYWDVLSVREWENQPNGTAGVFTAAAVDHMDVFGLIADFCRASTALVGSVLDTNTTFLCKEAFLDLIREGLSFVQYDSVIVEALLSILSPGELNLPSREQTSALASKVLHDNDQFRTAIVDQAIARYPYELRPLLCLFKLLAQARSRSGTSGSTEVVQMLQTLDSYTQMVPVGFKNFQLTNEDLNENDIILTEALPVFTSRSARFTPTNSGPGQTNNQQLVRQELVTVVSIGSGTAGRIVRENQPRVLKLDYCHSGLHYLSHLLCTFVPGIDLATSAPDVELSRIEAADIVELSTALLKAALRQPDAVEEAYRVMTAISDGLPNEQDVILVIGEIFETELMLYLEQTPQEGSCELLAACAEFFTCLLPVFPDRIWSHLARSSLLGLANETPALVAAMNGSDAPHSQYRFLKACVEMHASLLEDAMAGLSKRKGAPSRTVNRFADHTESTSQTPERTMCSVLGGYQRILLVVLQHLPDSGIQDLQYRCDINARIVETFTTLLECTYGMNLSGESSSQLTGIFVPAATSLLSVCVQPTSASSLTHTIADMFHDALAVARNELPIHLRRLVVRQTKSACSFLAVLLRTVNSGLSLLDLNQDGTKARQASSIDKSKTMSHALLSDNQPLTDQRAAALASLLLQYTPLIASLLACDAFQDEICTLLAEVVCIAGSSTHEPPSILAQLNADAQRALLTVVTRLNRAPRDIHVQLRAWKFLSAILRSRQQWFAVFLLTGELPKQGKGLKEPQPNKSRPLLSYALDQLSHIALLAPDRALGMLELVATAQQNFAWSTTSILSHTDFIQSILSWVESLKPAPREPSAGASIICAKEYLMASLVCDILAACLQASITTGSRHMVQQLAAKLSFLREHGANVNAYNRSLHRNLTDNLRRRYGAVHLSDFRRSAANPAPYGAEYFYDRRLAEVVLGHDTAWSAPPGSRAQGFSDEFARANANLSLLDGQLKLLASWKGLSLALCECAGQDSAISAELASVAEKCLSANVNPQLDEPYVAHALDMRVELAFVIISRLVSLKVPLQTMKNLLPAAWEVVRASPVDFDVATMPTDIRYYRELLQVLYLSIQPFLYTMQWGQDQNGRGDQELKYLPPATASVLVGVLSKVVAPGFRALCGNLHNNIDLALPADFGLITALLQAIFSVPGISSVHTLLADVVAGSGIIRGALSLYSWADELSEATGRDPVYGELATLFLLALSAVRPIAEQMALQGVLTNLSSGNLSNHFRRAGGKGPFDAPQRMFVIWSAGFLPLCLNLLDSVGPPIASEVAAFLNSFPEQLRRAEKSLQNEAPSLHKPRAGAITYGLVSEANSLMMIGTILESDAARSAADGINAAEIQPLEYDHATVRSIAEALARSKRSLNDRLVAVGPIEEMMLAKQTRDSGDNMLKQKVTKELDLLAGH